MPIFDDVQRRKKLAETCMRKLLLTDLAEPSQIGNANLLNVADISEEPDYNGSLQKNGCKDWESGNRRGRRRWMQWNNLKSLKLSLGVLCEPAHAH